MCCLVVLPVDHIRVNLLLVRIDPCPRRADPAGSGTPLANRCEQWECLSECRLAPFGGFNRRNSSDSAQGPEPGPTSKWPKCSTRQKNGNGRDWAADADGWRNDLRLPTTCQLRQNQAWEGPRADDA
jgi:hypothetical protein